MVTAKNITKKRGMLGKCRLALYFSIESHLVVYLLPVSLFSDFINILLNFSSCPKKLTSSIFGCAAAPQPRSPATLQPLPGPYTYRCMNVVFWKRSKRSLYRKPVVDKTSSSSGDGGNWSNYLQKYSLHVKERNNIRLHVLTFRCKILFATLTNSDKSRNPSKFSS